MDLIKNYGSYENAKAELDKIKSTKYRNYMYLEEALLDYRRANNIFEVGDNVVKTNPKLKFEYIRKVKGVFKDGSIWLDYAGYKWKPPRIRHATDLEIAAGHRL